MGDGFYRPESGPLDQGDLVIGSLLRALSLSDPSPEDHFARTPSEPVGSPFAVRGTGGPKECQTLRSLQAAMVVSHGCHLDRQYNRRVTELHSQGLPLTQARAEAQADRRLDRWVVVVPVFPLDAVRADRAALERGEAIGLFYLPPHPDGTVPEPAVADLGTKFSVDRMLLIRTATLAPGATDRLRAALMRVDLARTPRWDALERAVKARLVEVTVDGRDPVRARLRFSDGQEIQLAHPPQAAEPQGGRTEP